VSEKTLVYLYRYYHKKQKEYYDFAVFMPHHNLQHLVFQLGKGVDVDRVNDHTNGQWQFSGFEGDLTYLSWRTTKTDIKGSVIKGFDAKGEMLEDHFVYEPQNVQEFLHVGYGTTGKYYVQNDALYAYETGVVSYLDGQFYFTCLIDNEIVLMQRNNDHWEKLNSAPVGEIDPATDVVRMGAYPVHEGIVYHFKHKGVDKVGILPFEEGAQGMQEDFTPDSVYNPSRLLIPHAAEEFVTRVADKIVVCNLSQFNNSGTGIQFQHR
jgi:hypothetical protein